MAVYRKPTGKRTSMPPVVGWQRQGRYSRSGRSRTLLRQLQGAGGLELPGDGGAGAVLREVEHRHVASAVSVTRLPSRLWVMAPMVT